MFGIGDGVLALQSYDAINDVYSATVAVSDNGLLNGNFTFYQLPEGDEGLWRANSDGIYTKSHDSVNSSHSVNFYGYDGAGGFSSVENVYSYSGSDHNSNPYHYSPLKFEDQGQPFASIDPLTLSAVFSNTAQETISNGQDSNGVNIYLSDIDDDGDGIATIALAAPAGEYSYIPPIDFVITTNPYPGYGDTI